MIISFSWVIRIFRSIVNKIKNLKSYICFRTNVSTPSSSNYQRITFDEIVRNSPRNYGDQTTPYNRLFNSSNYDDFISDYNNLFQGRSVRRGMERESVIQIQRNMRQDMNRRDLFITEYERELSRDLRELANQLDLRYDGIRRGWIIESPKESNQITPKLKTIHGYAEENREATNANPEEKIDL